MPGSKQESSNQPGLDELLSLSKAAEHCGLSASHLRLLVREGEVWGMKLGRNWVTTEKAVREYLARNRRPGPKQD
ncbi:MAG: helix-turn-helix domain-containing protein [Chloroflexi bacterium]|nr:helix-turn-helix domain-containing protein [Chloroflexota bacterium]